MKREHLQSSSSPTKNITFPLPQCLWTFGYVALRDRTFTYKKRFSMHLVALRKRRFTYKRRFSTQTLRSTPTSCFKVSWEGLLWLSFYLSFRKEVSHLVWMHAFNFFIHASLWSFLSIFYWNLIPRTVFQVSGISTLLPPHSGHRRNT